MEDNYVCADCGKQQKPNSSCERCKSLRVVSVDFLTQIVGGDWKTMCFPEDKFPWAWEDQPVNPITIEEFNKLKETINNMKLRNTELESLNKALSEENEKFCNLKALLTR